MYYLVSFFLQASASGQPAYFNFLLIGAMVLVFWLFMIRPQAKKAKDQKKFINQIDKDDQIVTLSGIHGRIFKLNEDNTTFILETTTNNHIKMERSAISLELTRSYYPKSVAKK